jgi:hypothetical protein
LEARVGIVRLTCSDRGKNARFSSENKVNHPNRSQPTLSRLVSVLVSVPVSTFRPRNVPGVRRLAGRVCPAMTASVWQGSASSSESPEVPPGTHTASVPTGALLGPIPTGTPGDWASSHLQLAPQSLSQWQRIKASSVGDGDPQLLHLWKKFRSSVFMEESNSRTRIEIQASSVTVVACGHCEGTGACERSSNWNTSCHSCFEEAGVAYQGGCKVKCGPCGGVGKVAIRVR